MKLSRVTIDERSWSIDDQGRVHEHDNELEAEMAEGSPFSVCELETSRRFAVFLDEDVPEARRVAFAAHPLHELDGVVYADLESTPHDAVVRIAASVGTASAAQLPDCAFAACCIAYGSGSFKVAPERYLVRIVGRGDYEVQMEFDDDAACWYGEANELTP